MNRSRNLALVGALLLFLAGLPTLASHGIEATSRPGGAITSTRSDASPQRPEPPQLAAVPGTHRLVVVASRTHRRFGTGGAKLRVVGSFDRLVEPRAGTARIDVDAEPRLLRASNTPCCVRGPPPAA